MSSEHRTFTADELEELFHAALRAGDAKGVEAALRVMVTVDPHRAGELWDGLHIALDLCGVPHRRAQG